MHLDGVETFYPLSPLQQGLLFDTLLHPSSGAYFNQFIAALRGPIDLDALERAWAKVADRHAALRTFFVWEGLKEPVQVVERSVQIPWERHDWRNLSEADQALRFMAFLHAERERGFDLSTAPLMRLALIQNTEDLHTFVWSFHHTVLDGWSMYVVLKEMFGLYARTANGCEVSLQAPAPFRNYIAWLRRQDHEAARTYWRGRLRGVSPTLLPIGRRDPRESADRVEDSAAADLRLSATATAALLSMCHQRHLTVNTVVMGAWALLLSRYTRRDDVIFGATVSGRPPDLPQSDSMVGLLINTLPVRVDVTPDQPAIDWLTRLQAEQAEMRQYEYSPLFEIQGWCNLPRDRAIFESIYLFENYRKDESLEEMGRAIGLHDVQWYERTNYPLAVLAVPEDRLFLKAIYHRSRFDRATIQRLLRHWATLIEGIVEQPYALTADLPLLSVGERQQLLVEWNDTAAPYRDDLLVPDLIAARALQTPDALAVAYRDRRLTYRELDCRANQVAHRLRRLAVERGTRVALCMERSLELVVGLLGILKAGGAYVPVDPAYPRQRVQFMIRDSDARVVLTHQAVRDAVGDHEAEVVCLDAEYAAVEHEPDGVPAAGAGADDLAYVIYTSGSTGQPKGTGVSHRALLNLVFWHQGAFAVGATDRATQVAGPAFDALGWELWPYLTAGASVVLAPPDVVASPEAIRDWLASQNITITFLPTPLAERVLQLPWPADVRLRTLLTGGDRLYRAQPTGLPFEVVNNYGPTENTVVSTSGPVAPNDGLGDAPSIGRPISNTQVYILDHRLRPMPVGVPGELHVGGASLAEGYHNRPELTSEKFIANPFSEDPDARLYKTGDLARYLDDGAMEFLGRIDFQVQIRGYRIELGEIEAVLGQHPAVRETVVVARRDASGDDRLVAYVVVDGTVPMGELRAFTAAKLPDYMVPRFVVRMDALPLTPNGKVDRRVLPEPEGVRPELSTAFVAPGSEMELAIAEVWTDVLGLEQVGLHDNFFDLGGHSLSVLKVQGILRKRLEADLTIVDLFQYPTVASLAGYMRNGAEDDGSTHDGKDRADIRRSAMLRRRRGGAPGASRAETREDRQPDA